MNALVKKEIRLLLPSFLVGAAATFANFFLKEDQLGFNKFVSIVSVASCSAIAVFIALNSFGEEISSGTFSMLLAQPVSRHRIWRTKTLLLAAALFIGGFLWCAILYLRFEVFKHPEGLGDFGDIFLGTWLFLLVIYSGALWTVLLFRQMAAAFWFTLLVPMAILVVITNLVKNDDAGMIILCIVFALYSVAGFLFARRLFLRAQDVQWTGGTISLPAWLGFSGQTISSVRRPRRSLFALVRKEFQLHQVSILLAILLAVLDLVWIVLLKIRPSLLSGRSTVEIIILGFFGLFWFAIPWLVGSLTVAEERRLGTLEAQLCMPVTRRVQLFVKFAVALILGIFLGALLPWSLERIAALIGVKGEMFQAGFDWNELAARTIASAALVTISFYASTLARNTLQALGIGVVLTVVAWIIIVGLERTFEVRSWMSPIIVYIGFPIMLTVLIWLTHTNYKRLLEGWKTWYRNFIALTVSLISVVVVANTIYYRVWELVLPLEAHHGPPRLSESQPVTFQASESIIAVRLPDGRVWLDPVGGFLWKWPISLKREHFVKGSNWTQIAASQGAGLGIQSDGSLWCLRTPYTNAATQPIQIGAETNWVDVVAGWANFLLLKNDGSLWGWGTNYSSFNRTKLQAALSAPPFRIGSESDWTEIFQCGPLTCARKKDGRVWGLTCLSDKGKYKFFFVQSPGLNGNEWLNLSANWGYCAGVQSDGTLWVWSRFPQGANIPIYPKFQIGTNHRWKAVFLTDEGLFSLERNGTLWKWGPVWQTALSNNPALSVPTPVQLGNHSDWVAIAYGCRGILSMSADGSVWYWGERDYNPLLTPSRRPEKIANIFSTPP